jgi:hypothetical protein
MPSHSEESTVNGANAAEPFSTLEDQSTLPTTEPVDSVRLLFFPVISEKMSDSFSLKVSTHEPAPKPAELDASNEVSEEITDPESQTELVQKAKEEHAASDAEVPTTPLFRPSS